MKEKIIIFTNVNMCEYVEQILRIKKENTEALSTVKWEPFLLSTDLSFCLQHYVQSSNTGI